MNHETKILFFGLLIGLFCWSGAAPVVMAAAIDRGGRLFIETDRFSLKSADADTKGCTDESFLYVSYAGRRYFPKARRSDPIIEVYRIPAVDYAQIMKLTWKASRHPEKYLPKIKRLLAPHRDSMRVFAIVSLSRYRQFYPKGLHTGDIISREVFDTWDFTGPLELLPVIRLTRALPDTAAFVRYNDSVANPSLNRRSSLESLSAGLYFTFRPWEIEENNPYRTDTLNISESGLDSLYQNLGNYSPYLGARRIRFELYDNPLLASFFASIYVHYVDSITHILKDSLKIKPGESERYIQEISSIVTRRFKYASNFLLWDGIRKNRLDCDNTAYLAYDVGKNLGMDVSMVLARHHALITVGEFAYETTNTQYYPREDLEKEYHPIFLISSDPVSIIGMMVCYELGNYLATIGEYTRAKEIVTMGLNRFPGDPLLLVTLGDISKDQADYEHALQYYYMASKKMPDDLNLGLSISYVRERLIRSGKKDIVQDITGKFKREN